MSFDPAALFLSLIVSGIGFVLFVYGRKQERPPQLVAGLVLMVYPYFVESAWASLAIAAAICAAVWVAVRAGW